MTLLTLDGVSRSYGDQSVFAGISLRVQRGDCIGVVGDNGSGKTSLLEILAGEEEPDSGTRTPRRDLRIAHARQIPALQAGMTVAEFVARGDGHFDALEKRIFDLEARLAEAPDDARALRVYGELQGAFEAGGGFERGHLCERVLSGIGFDEAAWGKDVTVLSGGEKSRLQLCSLMAAPADLLLLDEPTNHLDLGGIEFLEAFVSRHAGAVVVVSHDRRFLDRFATTILHLHGGRVHRTRGGYSAFVLQREQNERSQAHARKSQQDFVAKEMAYIRRNMAGRMSAQAKGRLKRLQRLRLHEPPARSGQDMRLAFADSRVRAGQAVFEAEGLGARTPDGRTLFSGAAFRLVHGETLGILGANGSGKTSLLRILAGLAPVAEGSLRRMSGVRIGYFRQDMSDLPGAGTVLQALRAVDREATEKELRDHLALFGFGDREVGKEIHVLSGGEQRRLCLARLTRSTHDVLCLDEPTNHLDIRACEALEQALIAYPGAVALVSHDRQLLETLCDRVLVIEGGKIHRFDGGLEGYRKWLDAGRQRGRAGPAAPRPRGRQASPPGSGKIRNPLMFEKLEQQIISLEEEREGVRSEMTRPEVYADSGRMQNLSVRDRQIEEELVELYRKWESWA